MSSGESILIVDDEKSIRTVISQVLEKKGYCTQAASNATEALQACKEREFSLALVDLKMPGPLDGLGLLVTLARDYPVMVVILMTGYGTLESAVTALRNGASDYLTKPVDMPSLIKAVEHGLEKWRQGVRQKRLVETLDVAVKGLKSGKDPVTATARLDPIEEPSVETAKSSSLVRTSDLTLDLAKHLALHREKILELTTTEFDMLAYLVLHTDHVVTSSELVKAIRGYEVAEIDARPMVRVQIVRLRQKLRDDQEHPRYILNVRGKGYRFIAA